MRCGVASVTPRIAFQYTWPRGNTGITVEFHLQTQSFRMCSDTAGMVARGRVVHTLTAPGRSFARSDGFCGLVRLRS